jgi:hypothetical protein
MWADWQHSPSQHFYVNEVARIRGGRYLVPRRWVIYNGEEYADAELVSFDNQVSVKLISLYIFGSNYHCWRQSHSG